MSSEPDGMSAPEVVLVNSSTVRVLWLPPLRPNGAVTAYRVFLNGLLRGSVDSGSGSFLLGDLLPLTVYDVQVRAGKTFRCSIPSHKRVIVCLLCVRCCVCQVEVCTVYACVRSNVTQTTTVEDLPADIAAPHAQVLSSR